MNQANIHNRFRVLCQPLGGMMDCFDKLEESFYLAARIAIKNKCEVEVWDSMARNGRSEIWTFDVQGQVRITKIKGKDGNKTV